MNFVTEGLLVSLDEMKGDLRIGVAGVLGRVEGNVRYPYQVSSYVLRRKQRSVVL